MANGTSQTGSSLHAEAKHPSDERRRIMRASPLLGPSLSSRSSTDSTILIISMNKFLPRAFALGILALLPVHAADDVRAVNTGAKLTSDYNLKDSFDPQELRQLVGEPSSSKRRLMLLILRAGIEKDGSFQDLLRMPGLRESKCVDLALSGYDYMLNRSEAALDHILAQLATENIGADVDTIVVLSTLDEWERSIRAFRKHFIHTDGAGGDCKAGFATTRAYLFPKKYEKMRKVIETPIGWTEDLLPRTQ